MAVFYFKMKGNSAVIHVDFVLTQGDTDWLLFRTAETQTHLLFLFPFRLLKQVLS